MTGASAYVVTIFDQSGKEIVHSPLITTTNWTLDRALKRGREYAWEVVARKGDFEIGKAPAPPSPPARFVVLESAKAAEVEAANRRYSDSYLIVGIKCAEAGLLDEAVEKLKAALKQNPSSGAAKRILQSIPHRRGRETPPLP